jgi:hypothetical protein
MRVEIKRVFFQHKIKKFDDISADIALHKLYQDEACEGGEYCRMS